VKTSRKRVTVGLMAIIGMTAIFTLKHRTPPLTPQAQTPDALLSGSAPASPSPFVKLDHRGRGLPVNATDWQCVRDNSTGLVWETKTQGDGLHSVDHSFVWLDPDMTRNGGRQGYLDLPQDFEQARKLHRTPLPGDPETRGEICGHVLANCNTHDFAQAVNREGLCGFHDWRLPELTELGTLRDYSRSQPATDPRFFPREEGFRFWSATSQATRLAPDDTGKLGLWAWGLDFSTGTEEAEEKYMFMSARLVRGQMAEAPR